MARMTSAVRPLVADAGLIQAQQTGAPTAGRKAAAPAAGPDAPAGRTAAPATPAAGDAPRVPGRTFTRGTFVDVKA
jgi:hypothetical protein